MSPSPSAAAEPTHLTTLEVARLLGMAVRSVQLMVDRGELEAWKTPGGHRRIARDSVMRWRASRGVTAQPPARAPLAPRLGDGDEAPAGRHVVLLLEDSVHHQNLIRRLLQQQFPSVDLHVCGDGVSGLAMLGRLEPDVLIVDIPLPGVDGATLVTTLRSQPLFERTALIVVTSPDPGNAFALALEGLPVVQKPTLADELPDRLGLCLADAAFRHRAPSDPTHRP